jgi:hypothetical protein
MIDLSVSPLPTGTDRGLLWVPLLRRLMLVAPSTVVWKNASSALAGHGDLDVVASPTEWNGIESEFRRWAKAVGLHPVVVCRHVPGSMFLIAADPERPAFFELDVKARGTYRGRTIFRAADLLRLCELDSRAFRRLRPGAEGLLKLILNGTADDGTLNPQRVERERIVDLLDSDPVGAERAARLFGSACTHVLELVDGFLRGEWDQSLMLRLRARLRLGLLLEPAPMLGRLWSRIGPARSCRGIKSLLKEGRLVPGDDASLAELTRAHEVVRGAEVA